MKIGFIGGGNMASAMISALLNTNFKTKDEIFIYAKSKNDYIRLKFDIKICPNELELVKSTDIIVLAIKPNLYCAVLEKIKDCIQNKIVISIAPNITLDFLETFAKKSIRTMPNTPALIQKGVSALCFNDNILSSEREFVKSFFRCFGDIYEIDESMMATFVGVAGSLPAYVFVFIEALADAGVLNGLNREMAYKIISSSVAGSACLVKESKKHPAVLKDEVCSPAGTTIEAIKVLEEKSFRSSIIQAVDACIKKAKK